MLKLKITQIDKKILLILLMLFFLPMEADTGSEQDQYFSEIYGQLEEEMQKKYQMRFCGYGGGWDKGIARLSVHFQIFKKEDIDNLRKMFVDVNERLLYLINNNNNIRKHLNKFPFTIYEAHADIAIYADKKRATDDSVVAVFFAKGNIYYKKIEIIKRKNEPLRRWDGTYFDGEGEVEDERFVLVKEESYEEAKAIVMAAEKSPQPKEPY